MINTSRDNLPHIRSNQQREGITAAQARMGTHSESTQLTRQVGGEVTRLIDLKNVKSNYQDILRILCPQILYFNKNPIVGYMKPILDSLENSTLRVKRGMFFMIGGRYYEVKDTPSFDDDRVDAREVFLDNMNNNIPQSRDFDAIDVLANIVSFEEMVGLMLKKAGLSEGFKKGEYIDTSSFKKGEYIDTSGFGMPVDEIIKYPFLDKDGKPHATRAGLIQANDEILRQGNPRVDSRQDLIIKNLPNKNLK